MDSIQVDSRKTVFHRPLQAIAYSDKTPEWFQQNVEHLIQKANFNFGSDMTSRKDLKMLYGVYNNQFPTEWFKHVTDPLSAKKPQHKAFPAKIRPVTMLRTNIDLLLGEYPRRPFIYNVSNLGDTGYSRYMESMQKTARQTLEAHFLQAAIEEMQAQGQEITPEQMQQMQQEPPVPEIVKAEFQSSYKDAMAIKGQKYLKRVIREHEVRRKMHKMFKDWLITGETYSYKSVENNSLIYNRISPLCLDYDKSHSSDFIEDGEWAVYQDWVTLSDVVDRFYHVLKEKHVHELEKRAIYSTPTAFFNYLRDHVTLQDRFTKIPIYHTVWKGRKKIGFLSYLDMETFQYVEDVVDEDYIVDRAKGEQIEWRWVNEVYEGWRLHDDIYCNLQACDIQRNEMNNLSTCKLPYNGRKYSDTHSTNISILEIGIPFQILYIVTMYTLEKTIAKSKGKIALFDKKTIPTDGDWDEEKFFYYGEALGYALIDRSQPGVDKTMNQYHVLDLSLFDQIKQLIELMESFKQQWDDIIGITRQRKGQTYSSDGQGVNERSVFQSTVITDMIFLGFEEFTERELQGLMDLSQFTTSKGVYSLWNDDEMFNQLLEIAPEDFQFEELGVFVTGAAEELRKLTEMKQYAQAMIQNGAKPSTVLEVVDSINVAELKQKLRQIEAIQQQIDEQTAANEQEAAAAADQRAMQMKEYEAMLERRHMNEEYDRKEDIEMIRGTFNTFTFQNGDVNANQVPDAVEAQSIIQNQQKLQLEYQNKQADRAIKNKKLDADIEKQKHDMTMATEDKKLKKEKLKIDRKKASQKPAAKKK